MYLPLSLYVIIIVVMSTDYKMCTIVISQVAGAIEDLVQKHQRLPGNITYAIFDRIPYFRKKNE